MSRPRCTVAHILTPHPYSPSLLPVLTPHPCLVLACSPYPRQRAHDAARRRQARALPPSRGRQHELRYQPGGRRQRALRAGVGCWVGREPTPSPSLTLTLILTPIRILIRWAAGWGGSRRLRRSRSSCPSRRACYLVRYFVSQLVASQSVGRSQLVPKSMQVSGPVGNVVVKPATAPTEERMPWD